MCGKPPELDKYCFETELICQVLFDLHKSHGTVFGQRSYRLTCEKVRRRVRCEGISFLTVRLPALGKRLDKALAQNICLNTADLGFVAQTGSELPKFLGEFFNRVFDPSGMVLREPCAVSVEVIRQVTYLFYKYALPYTEEQKNEVVARFKRTERDLSSYSARLRNMRRHAEVSNETRRRPYETVDYANVVREARYLLNDVFAFFDPSDIWPRHGPGAVATKQQLWDKYQWSNISTRLQSQWPVDSYFYASPYHVLDTPDIQGKDLPARVVLVPKDSRGPRLISAEPVDFQWIQQGLREAVYRTVENHPLTKWNVFFTDQGPNQRGALLGSRTGRYATLDLKDASDRVSLELVRLLFPKSVKPALEAARSLSTVLPNGEELKLLKYAPMGSALCFPVMALTIWSILSAATPTKIRERILVYGDDVIVPTSYAGEAIKRLQFFGLMVNMDKSCISGLFKESCGVDAFKGRNVTPLKLKTVWSSHRSPDVYTSWIAYANHLWDKRYHTAYEHIVGHLHRIYGAIPDDDMLLACPSLRYVSEENRPKKRRTNRALQRQEWLVTTIRTPSIKHVRNDWVPLLRYFTEFGKAKSSFTHAGKTSNRSLYDPIDVSVCSYTERDTVKMCRRWLWVTRPNPQG